MKQKQAILVLVNNRGMGIPISHAELIAALSTRPYNFSIVDCEHNLSEMLLANKPCLTVANDRYSITQSGLDFLNANTPYSTPKPKQMDGTNTINGKWIHNNKWWLYPVIAALVITLIGLGLSMIAHKHGNL